MVAASLPAALNPATAGEGGAKRGAELIKQHRFASPSGRRLQLIRVVFMSSNRQSFHRVVAIDGPAASGKSSVARELAQRLGFAYVNSGAMSGAVTWHVLQHGVNPDDPARIAQTVDSARITCDLENNQSRILLDEVDP